MGIWLQRDGADRAQPASARRVALVLLGTGGTECLEPLLHSPVPAVDALIGPPGSNPGPQTVPFHPVRGAVASRDLLAGRGPRELSQYDQFLWLHPGERVVTGRDPAVLRRTAQLAARTCLVPVHYALPGELTLLSLEPRWVCARERHAPLGLFGLPVVSDNRPAAHPPEAREALASVLLYRAVQAALGGDSATAHSMLDHLYGQIATRSPSLAGVALRNGIALALAWESGAWLDRWVARAEAGFHECPEVGLLCALIPFFRGEAARAALQITALVERAPGIRSPQWISGGGETSYRALTFRGMAHAQLGDLNRAATDWASALQVNPDYLLPLQQIAGHRLHADVLDRFGLRHLVRGRQREFADLVAQAYAQSSQPELATVVVQPFGRSTAPPPAVPPDCSKETGGVEWEGAFFTASSLARVNREIASRLIGQVRHLAAVPTEPHSYAPTSGDRFSALADRQWRRLHRPDVVVRHHWPPSFRATGEGRLVIYLPWEFGPIPRPWVPLLEQVDAIWVYSDWVRRGLVQSGIAPDRIQIVPCGVDPDIFHPAPTMPVASGEAFHFLYVGGTILRKGFDLALHAFLAEFAADEPAVLTVKDFGATTFYRASSGLATVRAAAAEAAASDRRRVQVIETLLPDEDMADLYRSADCLLAPYRAEGFCMPALEAMACGTPAIVPNFGPALDYTRPETALLVEAEELQMGDRVESLWLTHPAVICQIAPQALRRRMRWAYEHRDELREIGRRAHSDVHTRFTWEQAARTACDHLRHLSGG